MTSLALSSSAGELVRGAIQSKELAAEFGECRVLRFARFLSPPKRAAVACSTFFPTPQRSRHAPRCSADDSPPCALLLPPSSVFSPLSHSAHSATDVISRRGVRCECAARRQRAHARAVRGDPSLQRRVRLGGVLRQAPVSRYTMLAVECCGSADRAARHTASGPSSRVRGGAACVGGRSAALRCAISRIEDALRVRFRSPRNGRDGRSGPVTGER